MPSRAQHLHEREQSLRVVAQLEFNDGAAVPMRLPISSNVRRAAQRVCSGRPRVQPIWFSGGLGHYWRDMCMRSSASVSSISLPLTSTVTLWMVPVNLNGLG